MAIEKSKINYKTQKVNPDQSTN